MPRPNCGIPLWGPGFLTDGVEAAAGPAGDGIKTVLHYVGDLDNAENQAFVKSFEAAYKIPPDVFAVQGWDAGQLLNVGLKAVGGDVTKRKELNAAMAAASFNSPRGPFKLSAAHNPIQNFYLRELKGGKNTNLGLAAAAVADEADRLQAGLIAPDRDQQREAGRSSACLFRAIQNVDCRCP